MKDEERFAEIDEEIAALRGACGQYEEAIDLLAELLTAVAVAIPQEGAGYGRAAERIDRVLTHRDAMAGKPLGEIPRRLAEQLRDDLRSFAAVDAGPPAPDSTQRVKFRVISRDRNK
jgi:hypothetical protein